jgi:two-component system chemotaxis response regulator CheB
VSEAGASPTMIRVLVVDDSVVVRQIVVRALADQPDVRVVGVASNGAIAIAKIPVLAPDVVILDLEMPEMDGFETLDEIRRTDSRLPVIVFSNLTARGAAATMEALARGATAFALKPSTDGFGLAQDYVRSELLPLIRALSRPSRPVPTGEARPEVASIPPVAMAVPAARPPFAAIVVAASTGGPRALADVVGHLPGDLRVPILIVQHMPPMFTKTLAERLDCSSALRVVEAVGGEAVLPGHVYIAPGNYHMAVSRTVGGVNVVVHDGPPENSCRPAADVLFRSAVEVFGAGVLAVVLTGMGRDGLQGARVVRSAGGSVIAQSAATAVVASMPAAVAEAGLVNAVVALDGIAGTLARWTSGVG